MDKIVEKVNEISQLSEEASKEFQRCIRTEEYKKGELIHNEGKVNKNLFFIESGATVEYSAGRSLKKLSVAIKKLFSSKKRNTYWLPSW